MDDLPENYASETPRRFANSREYRAYLCGPDMSHRDRTGWLGIEDSNSRILTQTMPLKCRGNF
jgi:hypothetical protein